MKNHKLSDQVLSTLGWISKYIDFAYRLTESVKEYHLGCALAILGSIIGTKVKFILGANEIYPNQYCILIGPSGEGRKSSSLNIAKKVIAAYDNSILIPNSFSTESFVEIIKDTPSSILIYDEIGRLLKEAKSRSYLEGVIELLTECYSGNVHYHKKLKSNEIKLSKSLSLSFLSASTNDWIVENLKESDISSGFLPRFIFIASYPNNRYLPIPPAINVEEIKDLAKDLHSIAKIEGIMKFSKEAEEIWKDYYIQSRNEKHIPFFAPFKIRLNDQVLKIAMTIELASNKSLILSRNSLMLAIEIIDTISSMMLGLINNDLILTKEGRVIQKVLNLIKSSKNIAHSEALKNSHLKALEFNNIISTLIESEKIKVKYENAINGKRNKVYTYVE